MTAATIAAVAGGTSFISFLLYLSAPLAGTESLRKAGFINAKLAGERPANLLKNLKEK
jgi:hypothetical protein